MTSRCKQDFRVILASTAVIYILGASPTLLRADTITVVGAGGETIGVSTSTAGNATITSNPNTATITGTTGSSGIFVTTPNSGTLMGAVTITNSPGFTIHSTDAGGATPPTNTGIYGAVDVSRASSLTLVNGAAASITGPNGIFYDMPSSSGVLNSITNLGSISGVGGNGANGAGIASFANTTSIVNDNGATITGLGYGIQVANSSNIGNLTNDGSIQGGNYGVAVSGSGTVTNSATGTITSANGIGIQIIGFGTVSNLGSISGAASGVYIKGGGSLNNAGSITLGNSLFAIPLSAVYFFSPGTVTNSGSISANTLAVDFNGGGTFNNSGTITGQVLMANHANTVSLFTGGVINGSLNMSTNTAATLILDGSGTQTYSAAVTGATIFNGSLIKQGSGAWTMDTAQTYSGGTMINAGTLAVGNAQGLGSGTVQVNGGTLMMGAGNRMLMDSGNYQQNTGNGTLLIAINNAGTDVVNLTTGHATLGAGTLEVNLAGLAPVPLGAAKITQKYAVLTTTQAVSGQFANFGFENGATGLSVVADYATNPDDVYVDVTSVSLFPNMGLTSNQQAIVNNINQALSDGISSPLFLGLGNAVTNNPASEGAFLNQLSPQAFAQFTSQTAFNNASVETEAMDNYLAGRRTGARGTFTGGNGHIDASGLTLNDPSYDPNLATVHSRLLAWNPGPLDGTVNDMVDPVLGGIEMKDSKDMKSMASSEVSDPWNFFVRGNVILAQGFSSQDTGHFNDNTESVVLGTDYRITPNFLIGLTAGYGHTDVTLDSNGSSATVDSYSPGLYASYANKGWYANASGNYTHNAYTQSRVIGFLGQTANSAPEGNQGTANLDGGYDFHHGALTFGPLAGLQYTHLTVDGFNETGSVADLSVNDDQSDSLRSRVGGRISYAFSHFGMSFTPHLDASWQHEFMDQSRGITSQFEEIGAGSFSVRTENASRDSALANVGFDAKINRTVTVFADYTVQAGQDNYFGQSVQAGLKIGF